MGTGTAKPQQVPLHPDVEPLAFLLGTWRGEGRGEYPTIPPFTYGEKVEFGHVGRPFLTYAQRTWSLDDGTPRHGESGYWRIHGDGTVELVLAHTTGVVEISTGSVDGAVVSVASQAVTLAPTAKDVTALERRFEVRGDALTYTLAMAAVGQPLTHHLAATLRRVGA